MVAKLVLDEITSSGSGITIDSSKTFTVNGELLTTGSTNVLHKTADYPIVTGDVAGKSELVVTTTTGAPRNITLPGLAVAGATTCVITIMVSADATGTDSLRVQEGTTEVWTGYQKGDFVRLCISDGAWTVLDHKETYYSRRYLTADQSIAADATTKLTGWTEVTEIGGAWDNTNNKIVTPAGMNGYWTVSFNPAAPDSAADNGLSPNLYLAGVSVSVWCHGPGSIYAANAGQNGITGCYYASATEAVEFYMSNVRSNSAHSARGTALNSTNFIAQFNRVY